MNCYKKARKEANLTQAELSAKIHVSQGSISQWETGATCPDVKTLIQLADLYGISLDSLVGRERPDDAAKSLSISIRIETQTESQLISDFRELTEDNKQSILKNVRFLLSEQVEEKGRAGATAG